MHLKNRKAFTMIELVFVIVIIGILSAIAVPKFAATRDDAVITKARVTIAALRSTLSTQRQKNILSGSFNAINGAALIGALDYPLDASWAVSGNNFTFTSPVSGTCIFTITNGRTLNKGTCTADGFSDL